jgi:hypothetical protein
VLRLAALAMTLLVASFLAVAGVAVVPGRPARSRRSPATAMAVGMRRFHCEGYSPRDGGWTGANGLVAGTEDDCGETRTMSSPSGCHFSVPLVFGAWAVEGFIHLLGGSGEILIYGVLPISYLFQTIDLVMIALFGAVGVIQAAKALRSDDDHDH